MQHKEDEQPNEAVHGRRKRILPFVRNTSRIPEQKKHQSSSSIAPSPGESSRGRGYGRGQDRGRGQGKHRGRGRGGGNLTRPPLELPRHIEGESSSQRNEFWGNGPQYALPEPPTLSGSSFGMQPGPSSGHSSSEKPLFEKAENPAGKWTSYPKIPGSQQAARQHQNSERPRKRFRPRKNASRRHNNQHNRNDGDSLPAEASTEKQSLQKSTDFVQGDCGDPPAKRPRIKEEAASPSRDSVSLGNQETAVKSEIEDESPIRLLQEEPTFGSKFISYDSHPMCRFECGRPSNQVRKHRRTLKQQEVQALRDQGMNILAAFIRDDGIAIDWSLPMNKNDISGSKPTVTFNDLESNSFSPSGGPISLRLSAQNMPLTPNVNPPVITMDEPENGVSSTSTTEIAYREVPIPPQHLPQNGNTGKLETWSLEQMRLLESELGLVVLSPPEFVGIGEYLTGQRLPEGVCPYVKIRYKRSERARPHVEPGANPDGTCSFAELIDDPPVPSHGSLHSVPSSPIDPNEPKLPPIAHIQASHSSPLGSQVLEKDEVDELADDPPSPLVRPSPTHTSTDNSYAFGSNVEALGENELSELHAATDEEFLHIVPTAPSEELDELQRLRRDLELSRMEAERKHKELEGRILELSRKRPESHTPRPGQEQQPTTAIRIVDEEKSNIIPLRRGKYDKTRRLLAVSNSTILHVSWLGVMQLIDKDSRGITATGFGSDPPSSISIEDACSLSPSSTALALLGHDSQLAVATLGKGSFDFRPLPGKPHDAKGICSIVPIDRQSAVTLGHDHRYMHWNFQPDQCLTNPLPLPKLHSCTALAFDPLHGNIVTAGSESNKRSKLTLGNLADLKHTSNTVELSNHPHHVHIDCDNPFLLILELARLDDQFQVHDMRMPLYQCVQKFGYQSVIHEKAEFRVRGSLNGKYFARGDTGIVRLWDRRSSQSHQTLPIIPMQRVVEVVLDRTLISCATEAHHILTYPIL